MKKIILVLIGLMFLVSCGNNEVESVNEKNEKSDSVHIFMYDDSVIQIICWEKTWSSFVVELTKWDYWLFTNEHVWDYWNGECWLPEYPTLKLDKPVFYNDHEFSDSWNYEDAENSIRDFVSFKIPWKIGMDIERIPFCDVDKLQWVKVWTISYPSYAYNEDSGVQFDNIITDWIISWYYNNNWDGNFGNTNYYISNKVDEWSSWWLVIAEVDVENYKGFNICILWMITWIKEGRYENQGIIQNIHNLVPQITILNREAEIEDDYNNQNND